ncbi:MAG TPA: hypothetical protein VMM92_03915, partial [Thermoanaerobaculia bacterium]|nr:hypothetical protein [Thermoanaerobaculia bacterium]
MPPALHLGLILSPLGLVRGGAEAMAAQWAVGLSRRGHRVTLVGGVWPGRALPMDLAALPVSWIRVPCAPANLGHAL